MTTTATITRIERDGPNGLEEWEQMDYASLDSGTPVQHGHLYHEVEDSGYMVGVWNCTAFVDKMMPYSVDEYMLFLSGDLTMIMPDGEEIKITAGDAFVIPKGLMCQWKQDGPVHKIFMILNGEIPEAQNVSLTRITLPDLAALDASTSTDLISDRTDFINAAGNMRVGVQTYGAMSQPGFGIKDNQLITVLDGTLHLNDGEETHSFSAGQTAYIHQGGTVGWTTEAGTRTITASYTTRG